MSSLQLEIEFENAVEAELLGPGCWLKGESADFDAATAIDKRQLVLFIESTQSASWNALRKQHGNALESAVLETINKNLDDRGTLAVLRQGIKFYGKKIDLAYFKPSHNLNPEIIELYGKNRLVVTRQVRFNPGTDESIDLLLSLNGIPIATAELKNPLTGQTAEDAKKQYKRRDPRAKLFEFKKRALVHFAIDTELVFMTTELRGEATVFLPFNLGVDSGAGNPPNPLGYRTDYLWKGVWHRDSFLDLLARFLHVLKEELTIDGKKITKESVIFPRYHQLDVVRQLESDARREGSGHNYLIQHSAGSGKSNSIAWLAHRLATLHSSADAKIFDSVIVVTDRRVLDKQLQDTVFQFEHKGGVVARIDEHSTQLAEALKSGTPIIITTLQKFPFVIEKVGELPDRRYAVIVDEAHSSQGGEAARKMKEVLAVNSLEDAEKEEAEELPTFDDEIEKVMRSRGQQPNLSFFAFTATPKYKTLEVFGMRGPDGKPVAHHVYSMKQAIDEGFILDVLKNYTTYKNYYRLVKAIEDDPNLSKREATAALARFMSIHPFNVAQKTEVIVEHFRTNVRKKIGGKAKAMVVTGSRLHAVRYRQAFDRYIREKGYGDVHVLVAFSGAVKDPEDGAEYTEPGMNLTRDGKRIGEKELPGKFKSDEYQLLIVANKYQTGYDEPLLHTMYVDKRLSGVQAVQTLSRLNRRAPGKEDTFVLDFVNDAEEIRRSFQPYFEATTVSEQADPQHLYTLQHELEAAQVFYVSEVESFAKVFFKPISAREATDQGSLYALLAPATDRFKALDADARETFKIALGAFVRLYAFISQVMPFTDADLEKLYAFARSLLRLLPKRTDEDKVVFDDEVTLRYYRLQKIAEGPIALVSGTPGEVKAPTEVGTQRAEDKKAHLSEIIEVVNERFGTDFTPADQLFFDQVAEEAKSDDAIVQRANANDYENFALSIRKSIEGLMIDRMDSNASIVAKYVNEVEFQRVVFEEMAKKIYRELRAGTAGESSFADSHET